MAGTDRTHKVAKGDTLIGIAKKYKHKSWKTIWNDPKNKGVRSKRKEPDLIRAGDILVIPPTEAEKKKAEAEQAAAAATMVQETMLSAHLGAKGAALEAAVKAVGNALKLMQASVKTVDGQILAVVQAKQLPFVPLPDVQIRQLKALCTGQLALVATAARAALKEVGKQAKDAAKLGAGGGAGSAVGAAGKKAATALLGKTTPELDTMSKSLERIAKSADAAAKNALWKKAESFAGNPQFYGMGAWQLLDKDMKGLKLSLQGVLAQVKLLKSGQVQPLSVHLALAAARATVCKNEAKNAQSRARDAEKALGKLEKAAA
ncbi:hypothetical protein LNKW23_38620 [Paralimibaculum aggregatum]|uniref:LysM domain-containing protein n=1 Tax=Paralimibaculum aggregatum TaxID=3036245 RepID=A0ABQ6LN82_9RHOB|nr:LysM domain-containing protein [Limibaculum sp. NKW23]GMG84646.1 hypothetical protein LNKW23_38620 [Limibaculum sp. NKW23]